MAGIMDKIAGRRPWMWAVAFVGVMGIIAWFEHRHVLGGIRSIPFVAAGCLFLIPMAKSANNCASASGTLTPAMRQYNRRMMIWAVSYIVLLGTAMSIRNNLDPRGPLLWLIAVLPSLPMLFFIWAMVRYLKEETDEYLRLRNTLNALFGLALLLGVGTFWGFLEAFKVVPHVDAWWVVPVWAMGMGLANIFQVVRDRKGDDQ